MGCSYAISEVVRMIEACAPGATLSVRNHCIFAVHAGRRVALPRGEGRPRTAREARGQAHDYQVRKIADQLELNRDCVERWFPGLWA